MKFKILKHNANARTGIIYTNHGNVNTPNFMPVGTLGTVKGLDASDLISAGAEIMLSNTYHLILRPGAEMISRRGGLHKFTGWNHPILTDSGGFQVMSLSDFRKISDDGVEFASHLDGQKIFLSPEEALRAQNLFGSDIQMVLDVCPPADADEDEVKKATELSHKWAERAVKYEKPDGVLRFGIVQGGFDEALREESAKFISSLPFDGYAIGGLSVGEPEEVMFRMLEVVLPYLPLDKPRYLMGVGKLSQLEKAIDMGVDLFDCVEPTRIARHGTFWTSEGEIRINRKEFEEDKRPIDMNCRCLTCSSHSRAYIRHIYRTKDPLYIRLASLHNLTYLLSKVKSRRKTI